MGRIRDKRVTLNGGRWIVIMKIKLVASSILLLSLGACATVDIADMTTLGGDKTVSTAPQSNVVINASDKLYASFEEKGLCLSQSERMKTAAAALLKGREALTNHPESAYVNQGYAIGKIRSDLSQAASLLENTSKAAEVYLDLAPTDADLRPELKRLEQAIYATQSAQRQFNMAIEKAQPGTPDEMKEYQAAAEDLRLITNTYGDRVRSAGQAQAEAGS